MLEITSSISLTDVVAPNGAVTIKNKLTEDEALDLSMLLDASPPEHFRSLIVTAALPTASLYAITLSLLSPAFRCAITIDLSSSPSSVDDEVIRSLTSVILNGSLPSIQRLSIGVPDPTPSSPLSQIPLLPEDPINSLIAALASGHTPVLTKVSLLNVALEDSTVAALAGLAASHRKIKCITIPSARAPAVVRDFFSALPRRVDPPPFPQALVGGPLSITQGVVNATAATTEGVRLLLPLLTGCLEAEATSADGRYLFV